MENWKKLRDSQYSVSDLGRVRNDNTNHILTPRDNGAGRLLVDLRKSVIGKNIQVHRLVAECFIRPLIVGEKLEVNHKDGNPKNNSLINLEYVSASDNMRHAFQNGLRYKKEIPKFTKMRDDIFQLKSEGYSQSKIAKTLEVNQSHVSRTLRGEAYTTLNQQGVTL